MKFLAERTNKRRMRIPILVAGSFFLMGLPMALALADLHTTLAAAKHHAAVIQTEEGPIHSAQAQFDVGPGSDEAQVATLPVNH